MKKLITNANVFNGVDNNLIKNVSILIEDNLITQIGEVDTTLADEIIDAQGGTVMPGLIDAHVHITLSAPFNVIDTMTREEVAIRSAKISEEMLMRGFTTIRDVAGNTLGLKKSIDNGYATGPRILPSMAAISQTSGHSDYRQNQAQERLANGHEDSPMMKLGAMRVADGRSEVLKAVREQLFMGASQIKIMAGGGASSTFDPLDTLQFTSDEMEAAVQAASDYGTYVAAHIHTSDAMRRAAEAGVMSFEHATIMDDDIAEIIKEKGIWVIPSYFTSSLIAERKIPLPNEETYRKTERVGKAMFKSAELIKKYDIRNIAFGTDCVGETNVHATQLNELGAIEQVFDTITALRMATSNCGRLFEMSTYQHPYQEGKLGQIVEGAYADLLIIDGNPLEGVACVANTDTQKLIMKDGNVYKNTL
ncbi:metal-dependent hydrolase family protein [Vibrio crassostreae]|uniref:Amidohydrolase-related domain-containing protein n=1 Tax=Vibrio crassostreae TaxID=246167 RepID=A0ABP1WN57_9VIBR|nr:amidohydrolase family protein [Vibrio crassostreae]TCL29970.1 imidazolonepropionase-like amidohydrolase [Vibrio crassostreae]TCT53880.1 imidazolonepropionase-like amidohydrolase [Vibrio crassostreae]TCT62344.1 imidazolonepropionase-like amidohydrolase [Vibrio crassostreae]CAK1833073.1 Imidazolonepropionase-like amidohydrolase [Vibrio crassostreae]CAK1843968.1 Imidazolonepropionase-like amidohydrolase [Vibrio crassostreae]